MRTAFLNELLILLREHKDIFVITADMGFSIFEEVQKEFPEQFLNTGVTEQSSIGIATGLALSGYTVYFYAQAPFATMRCFEQVRLDVAYQNINVKIIGTASGFSSNQLGVSHFSMEDIALMRLLPNLTIFSPGDPLESAWATKAAYKIPGPVYIRITKNGNPIIHDTKKTFEIGKGIEIAKGSDFTLLVSGSLLPMAKQVIDNLANKKIVGTLISLPVVKPIDKEIILKAAKETRYLFTLEEHSIIGGLGSAVAEILAESDSSVFFRRFGVPDKFTSITGSPQYLLDYNGLSQEKIVKKIIGYLS
ncbi:1-deoxy-D-xylulose-5-phosphate synthase [Candidatus Woesearchaeota archaeon]|nr:1-deoxy-D-xylulose-5-phosphate synthase [Candidatus Woesearchaeota archaeon]